MTAFASPQRDPTAVVGRRIGAYFIDLVLIAIIASLIAAPFLKELRGVPAGEDCAWVQDNTDFNLCAQSDDTIYVLEDSSLAPLSLAWLAGFVLYWGVLQGLTGATIGKFLTGVRVVKRDGRYPGIGRSLLRSIFRLVPFADVVGFILILTTNRHQRLGDMAAGTYVVGKGSVGTPPDAPAAYGMATGVVPPPPGAFAPGGAPGSARPPTYDPGAGFGTPPVTTPSSAPPASAPPANAPAEQPTGLWLPPDLESQPPTAAAPPPAPEPTPPAGPDLPPAPGGATPQWNDAHGAFLAWDGSTWHKFDEVTRSWQAL